MDRSARYRLTSGRRRHRQTLRRHDLKALTGGDGLFGLAHHASYSGLRRVADDALRPTTPRRLLQARGVGTALQAIQEIVETVATTAVVGRQVVVERHIRDGFDGAPQVVEHQQRVDHQQGARGRSSGLFGAGRNPWLELSSQLVGQVSHRPASETRQAG